MRIPLWIRFFLSKHGMLLLFRHLLFRCFCLPKGMFLLSCVLYVFLSFSRSSLWWFVVLSFCRFVVSSFVVSLLDSLMCMFQMCDPNNTKKHYRQVYWRVPSFCFVMLSFVRYIRIFYVFSAKIWLWIVPKQLIYNIIIIEFILE